MLEPKDRYNNVEMPVYYIVHTKNKEGIQNLHYHTYVEILCILDGESHVQINNPDYFLKTEDLIIIPTYFFAKTNLKMLLFPNLS